MKTVLEKVRKNKPRVQKEPKRSKAVATPGREDREGGHHASSWKDRMPKQIQQFIGHKKKAKYLDMPADSRESLLPHGNNC